MHSISGIFFTVFAIVNPLFSQIFKIILWQPADSYLTHPYLTIQAITLSWIGIFFAIFATRMLKNRIPRIFGELNPNAVVLQKMATLCIVFGVFYNLLFAVFFSFAPEYYGLMQYLAFLPTAGIGFASGSQIILTNGRSCTGWRVWLGVLLTMPQAILGFSKASMAMPFLLVFLCMLYYDFKLRWIHVFSGVAVVSAFLTILYPLAYGLGHSYFSDQYNEVNVGTLFRFLDDIADEGGIVNFVNRVRQESLEGYYADSGSKKYDQYYGKFYGSIDRLSMIAPTDALIDTTLEKGTEGYSFILKSVTVLPKSFTGVSADFNGANFLGRKTGILADDDLVTGISFGPVGDAFAIDGLRGSFLLAFFGMFIFFIGMLFVDQNTKKNIVGVIFSLSFVSQLQEVTFSFPIFLLTRSVPVFFLAIYALRKIATLNISQKLPKKNPEVTTL